eukprot:11195442-Lingulodinium_polyedra.AAC.1
MCAFARSAKEAWLAGPSLRNLRGARGAQAEQASTGHGGRGALARSGGRSPGPGAGGGDLAGRPLPAGGAGRGRRGAGGLGLPATRGPPALRERHGPPKAPGRALPRAAVGAGFVDVIPDPQAAARA